MGSIRELGAASANSLRAGLGDREVLGNVLEEAGWAEELGFDAIWLAEHHFSPYGTISSLPVAAAAIAAVTERIRIGTACMVPAFHNPIHLAEQIAMVDVLSDGRFEAGFGRGYQAHEFRGFGVPMGESTARFREAIAIIEGLLTNERFSYDGQFTTIPRTTPKVWTTLNPSIAIEVVVRKWGVSSRGIVVRKLF